MRKQLDLIGLSYGMLTVTQRVPSALMRGSVKHVEWYTDCDCGTKNYVVRQDKLRGELDCGCLNPKKLRHASPSRLTERNYTIHPIIEDFLYGKHNNKSTCAMDDGTRIVNGTR